MSARGEAYIYMTEKAVAFLRDAARGMDAVYPPRMKSPFLRADADNSFPFPVLQLQLHGCARPLPQRQAPVD